MDIINFLWTLLKALLLVIAILIVIRTLIYYIQYIQLRKYKRLTYKLSDEEMDMFLDALEETMKKEEK